MSSDSPGYLRILLDYPDFRRLYLARTISLIGDWFNLIALLALLRELGSSSPGIISGLYVVKLLPGFLIALPAGVAADRFNRRGIMILSDIARFVLTLGIFTAFYFPAFGTELVLGLTVLSVMSSGFFEPARTASIPNLIPSELLPNANALGAITWSVVFTLGVGLGGAVTEFLGWRWALLMDASTFLISAAILYRARIPNPVGTPTNSSASKPAASSKQSRGLRPGGFREGLRYIRGRKDLIVLLFLKPGWCLAGAITFILTLYGQQKYHFGFGPDLGVAVLLVSRAVGTGLGPVLARRFTRNDPARMRKAATLGFLAGAIFYIAFSRTDNPWLACVLIILAHVGGSIVWVFSTVLLQKAAPDEFRGRIFALEMGSFQLVISASIFIYGLLAGIPGMRLETLALALGVTQLLPAALWAWFGSEKRFAKFQMKPEGLP